MGATHLPRMLSQRSTGGSGRSGRLLLGLKTLIYRLMDSDSQSDTNRRIAIRLSFHSWGQTMKGEA